jgi:hypothetical protein
MTAARTVFTWAPSRFLSPFDAAAARGGSASGTRVDVFLRLKSIERWWRSGDWTRWAVVIKWAHPHDGKEKSMTGTKAIGKKIGNIEDQLKKRVRSLEKDLTNLVKKLGKKETEVEKLRKKMTSKFVKSVKKKAKKAKKTVAKRLSNIL